MLPNVTRTQLYADAEGIFLHDAILSACQRYGDRTAIVDTSIDPPHRISYSQYGEMVEQTARGFVAAGIAPGEVIAIYLPNCWEFAVAYHAATLAGAIPTLLNPSYREREVLFQLEDSGAVALISDGMQTKDISLAGIANLRQAWFIRNSFAGATSFSELLKPSSAKLPQPNSDSRETLAVLPYSSGTTGLPKGVMLSHYNIVVNCYQQLVRDEEVAASENEFMLGFLPLYHIYGLNVVLNPLLLAGGKLVLMPRYDTEQMCALVAREQITFIPMVPPVINLLCHASAKGLFPADHQVRAVNSGAAPLAPELPKRLADLTGIRLIQGYGMTEASPVTHRGFLEKELYRPESIGPPLALTECRLVDEQGLDVAPGEPGELLMRGPQFMRGYWNAPAATAEVMREGWYWSGDIAVRDAHGFFKIVDRRKEMIKYKGFPIAPAEVEAVLLEHPAVRDCGVVGRPDECAGEIPCAFIVLRDEFQGSGKLESDLCGHVAERLSHFKQPREVRFVSAIPRNPSGKILRKDLRTQL